MDTDSSVVFISSLDRKMGIAILLSLRHNLPTLRRVSFSVDSKIERRSSKGRVSKDAGRSAIEKQS